jgi:excisionase family DNA binding protein
MLTQGGVSLWTQSDAAHYLGVARQRIYVLIAQGKLATVTVRSKRYVEHRSLMDYAAKHKQICMDADLLAAGRKVR